MALYVTFTQDELTAICRAYGLGALVDATGIPQGSINTNYRLEAERGRFFLRHTQVRSADVLRFEAELLAHLERFHFPSPSVLRTSSGEFFLSIKDGLASVFSYVAGEELGRQRLTETHLESLGAELGKMHRATSSFGLQRENPYSPRVVEGWLSDLKRRPEAELVEIAGELQQALTHSQAFGELLPRGVIHADLFMDNVKWLGDRVSAFFDFEMACFDTYALDVAITLNAWCFEGEYTAPLCRAFIQGYLSQRPLSPIERSGLFGCALFGAVRYTASRIRDFHLSPLPPEKLTKKDFRTYLRRCRALRAMGPDGFRELLGL